MVHRFSFIFCINNGLEKTIIYTEIVNQTTQYSPLTKYNIRNSFFEKSCTGCGGEASPRPFTKNQNQTYL